MKPRWIRESLERALQVMPVVFLQGARQVGKTTLAQQLVEAGALHAYLSLDDLALLQAAQRDPQGVVASLPERAVIDEVQRAPQVLLPLKARIDANRRAGMFLLTGSASPQALAHAADALVGRMAVLTLHPFSQGEIEGVRETWLARAFEGRWQIATVPPDEVWRRVLRGGYPEAVLRAEPAERRLWFRALADTLLTRDVAMLADIERTADMAHLLQLLAALCLPTAECGEPLARDGHAPHDAATLLAGCWNG
jgi:predicted AAA+ superfamily ATPase